MLPVALWALARRKGALGPLAAVAVAVTPMLFWQATTAYDDLRIALAALGCSVAMLIALQPQFTGSGRATGLAIGLMAGTLVSVKIHEVVPAGALVLAWALSSGGRRLAGSQVAGRRVDDSQAAWRHVVARQVAVRLTWALAGALVTASVPFVLRFIDTGNPVFPYYNNIFHSRTGRRRTISRASRGSPRPGRSVPHERCGTRWSTAGS